MITVPQPQQDRTTVESLLLTALVLDGATGDGAHTFLAAEDEDFFSFCDLDF